MAAWGSKYMMKEERNSYTQDDIKNSIATTSVETKTAFPFEHIDMKSENTYFHRPAGLY